MGWVFLGSFFCVYVVEMDSSSLFQEHKNTLLTLILGTSWLIGLQLLLERTNNTKRLLWTKGCLLLLLGLFHYHLPPPTPYGADPTYMIRFFLFLLSGHLFILFSPFLQNRDNEAHWRYLGNVGTAIGRSLLFTAILYLGLVLALMAIKFLFDHQLDSKRYGQLFILCMGVANTWIFLSDFPKTLTDSSPVTFGKPMEVMTKYILVPLSMLYLVILYAYGFKIIMAWELPRGWVSNLVIILALLGFTLQALLLPLQKSNQNGFFKNFHPWFHLLMCPLIALLFLAILRRILDYGITENRYFVLILALWILGNTLYFLVASKKDLRVLPISLFLLALSASFGPWGAFNISKASQTAQFSKIYATVRNNDLRATADSYGRLRSILHYLYERGSLSRLDGVVGINFEQALKGSWTESNYLHHEKVLDSLRISLDKNGTASEWDRNYHHYYGPAGNSYSDSIPGFEHFSYFRTNQVDREVGKIGKYHIEFHKIPNELILVEKRNGPPALSIPLHKKLMSLGQYPDLNTLDTETLQLTKENDSLYIRLVFTELDFYQKADSVVLNNAAILLFLKRR
tara:strand:+ start:82678 stop:84390 length:1713 start_codon:yes stop_codon:yes gene_type:complete